MVMAVKHSVVEYAEEFITKTALERFGRIAQEWDFGMPRRSRSRWY